MSAYFFVFGMPKSGTTFLQMLLNAHPRLACPSEHQFDYLIQCLTESVELYNKVLVEVDSRTARQGASVLHPRDLQAVIRYSIELALLQGQNESPTQHFGANDNAIINRIPYYMEMFPDARFVCIVRDPRDVAVSSWHHNLRVEEGFLGRARNLDDWLSAVCMTWGTTMRNVKDIAARNPDHVKIVRYEDLQSTDRRELADILAFLGVAPDETDISTCFDAVDFSSLSAPSVEGGINPFFRRGGKADWRDELDAAVADSAVDRVRDIMDHYGYQ